MRLAVPRLFLTELWLLSQEKVQPDEKVNTRSPQCPCPLPTDSVALDFTPRMLLPAPGQTWACANSQRHRPCHVPSCGATVQAVPGLVTPIDGMAMAMERVWEDITRLWKIIGLWLMWNSPWNCFLMWSCSWLGSEGEKAPRLVEDLELISKGQHGVLLAKKLKAWRFLNHKIQRDGVEDDTEVQKNTVKKHIPASVGVDGKGQTHPKIGVQPHPCPIQAAGAEPRLGLAAEVPSGLDVVDEE
ncbi:hypothetical protein HGM15179_014470 [Zosterops borbonicus]|uniref:Uncharacterized protein n=1 Tax=Zosterops borbonicus TaxID=364589 RepID=A0A8K1LG77_9PASS|nr:hypothetical protein HGM15179_014470 [Zosterops borbonicus]